MDSKVRFGGLVGHWLRVFAGVVWGPFWGTLPTSILQRLAMILGVIVVPFGMLWGEELEKRKTVFRLRRRERIACRALPFGASLACFLEALRRVAFLLIWVQCWAPFGRVLGC